MGVTTSDKFMRTQQRPRVFTRWVGWEVWSQRGLRTPDSSHRLFGPMTDTTSAGLPQGTRLQRSPATTKGQRDFSRAAHKTKPWF